MADKLTEEEAKGKVCQEMSSGNNLVFCMGDDCMSWLWSNKNPLNWKDEGGRQMAREKWTGFCSKVQRGG
jgi:hypothetical protein